ncbi:MAG: hypothetical protein NC336_10290 [Clostridium sp.]|nr:hypothetical protein [Clostridium sp.]
MKKLLSTFAVLLFGISFAAAQSVTLHLKDGSSQTFDYSELDRLVIENNGPKIDIRVSNVLQTSADFDVTCSDESVSFYWDICSRSEFERVNGDVASIITNYIKSIQQQYDDYMTLDQILDAMLDYGHSSQTISGFPAGTDMVCYAMPVDGNGTPWGNAVTAEFRTLDPGDPADCTFDLSVSSVGSTDCDVNIAPSDPSVRYWYGVMPVSDYAGDVPLTTLVRQYLVQAAGEYNMTLENIVEAVCFRGETHLEESGLEVSTPYYLYAYAMADDGSAAGPVYKIRFTTTEYDYSDAAISLSYRYFDGSELYKLDPVANAKYKDGVAVEVVVEPNETCAHWVYALGSGLMMDQDIYPDDATMDAMMQAGQMDKTRYIYAARWGEATFVYFGADEYWVNGPLLRMAVDFVKDGCADPSLFSPIDAVAAPEALAAGAVSRRLKAKTAVSSFRQIK